MSRRWKICLTLALGVALAGCAKDPAEKVDDSAEAYVKLALALGELDKSYIGYYHGPDEWLAGATVAGTTLPRIREQAQKLHEELVALEAPAEPSERLRLAALDQMLTAMVARVEILEGRYPASFDEETKRLYDVVIPPRDEAYFRGLFGKLDALLPGEEPLVVRLPKHQDKPVVVPPDHLPAVLEAALDECRRRTLLHIDLPENEHVTFEYLTDVPFGGRSVYLGDGQSILQVNTRVSMTFDAVVELACHEGYPGHHVQNVLLDKHLVQDRGWVEYTLDPLYSAGALIAEGAATYGVELAFPADELRQFKADVLLPLAGIDPAELGEPSPIPVEVRKRARETLVLLRGVGEEVARQYLDGDLERDRALQWLAVFGLMGSKEAAEGYLRSIENDRSHLINRGYAEQLVRWMIELRSKAQGDARWTAMADLFTRPFVVAGD